jgi:fluoroacetyl-CoA thioesterase
MQQIELGADRRSATVTRDVTASDTAAMYGPDFPPAASTPFVLGIAEVACHSAIAPSLKEGEITVGMRALVEHLLPSRVGTTLSAQARLVRRSRSRLYFQVEVWDGSNVVARIKHLRAVVNLAKMQARLEAQ